MGKSVNRLRGKQENIKTATELHGKSLKLKEMILCASVNSVANFKKAEAVKMASAFFY